MPATLRIGATEQWVKPWRLALLQIRTICCSAPSQVSFRNPHFSLAKRNVLGLLAPLPREKGEKNETESIYAH